MPKQAFDFKIESVTLRFEADTLSVVKLQSSEKQGVEILVSNIMFLTIDTQHAHNPALRLKIKLP